MSNGTWIYNWTKRAFQWVVNGVAYDRCGDENKPRPHVATPVVKKPQQKDKAQQ